jgi:hypothetical protein
MYESALQFVKHIHIQTVAIPQTIPDEAARSQPGRALKVIGGLLTRGRPKRQAYPRNRQGTNALISVCTSANCPAVICHKSA